MYKLFGLRVPDYSFSNNMNFEKAKKVKLTNASIYSTTAINFAVLII